MADKEAEEATQEEPQKEATDTPSGSTDQDIKAKPSRPRRWPWLLLIIVLGLPSIWFLMPAEMRQPYAERLQQWLDQRPPIAADTPTKVDAPIETSIHQEENALEQVPTPLASSMPEAAPSSASSGEVEALIQSIGSLQARLNQMQDGQESLVRAINARQDIDLHMRLRWVSQPGTRLHQLQAYWEDIVLLPMLSNDERTNALRMLQLTRQHAASVRTWQDRLTHLANALPIPEAREINIKPDNKWLAWLAGQFRLRTSPSREGKRLLALRSQLLAAEQQLAHEQWPESEAWQQLLGQLKRQMDGDAELMLPEGFETVQNDILNIRQAAQSWLEGLTGNVPEELN